MGGVPISSVAPGLLAPDPGDFSPAGKVTKSAPDLRSWTPLLIRGFFIYATTCLTLFPNLCYGPMAVESPPPPPGPMAFFVGFAS